MARTRSAEPFVRKNVTLPRDFEARLAQLRTRTGAASDSELIRQALIRLEDAFGLRLPEQQIKVLEPSG